jgi:bis(5'-nucleosyl)-tetraphosphatase (symmetrical)
VKRRVFVGDIQGCREELERLLEALRFDPAADELHPVGDLVNRGPDSGGVLRLLRDLDVGGVLGNHDLHLLAIARGARPTGARDTLDELLAAPDLPELLDWLRARPFVRAWPDLVLVHAGLHPIWDDPLRALAGEDPERPGPDAQFAVSVRYCDARGLRPPGDWPPPHPPYVPWYEHWRARAREARTVVFGHWARAGLVQLPRVRGLDTGCVYGKQLSAWIAEEDRVVQVDAARPYRRTTLPDGP